MYFIPTTAGEAFYLYTLLIVVKGNIDHKMKMTQDQLFLHIGATSKDLYTVNGHFKINSKRAVAHMVSCGMIKNDCSLETWLMDSEW